MGFIKGSSVGLEISQEFISVVELESNGNGFALKRYGKTENISSLINPSFSAKNIADEEKFKEAVKNLFQRNLINTRHVSVALPDDSVKVSFLEFEDIPKERDKVMELIKWNIKKALPFPDSEAVIDFQIMEFPAGANRLYKLATAIMRRTVLDQYERILTACQFHPDSILPSSFAMYNLYHDNLAGAELCALLTASKKKISATVIKDRKPCFFRNKGIDDEQQGVREIVASINYYQDVYAAMPKKLYFIDLGFGFANLKEGLEKNLEGLDIRPLRMSSVIKDVNGSLDNFSGAAGAALRTESGK